LNAFICEPQANIVKRNILNFGAIKTSAMQAWNDKEFIASTDEGFRPVNLANGPDGAMYVVDMHRGIMEYSAFSTPYYNHGLATKKLDTLLHMGRILRITYKYKKPDKIPEIDKASANQLVALLNSKNGWVRDHAQQILIYKQQKSAIPELTALTQDGKNSITAIHALHTLDGLNALSFELLEKVAGNGVSPMLSAHALTLLEKYNSVGNVKSMAGLANTLLNKNDSVINLYLATSLGPWLKVSSKTFLPILTKISQIYPSTTIYQEAVASSLNGFEKKFQALLNTTINKSKDRLIDSILASTLKNSGEGKMNSIFLKERVPNDARTNGLLIFRSTCSTCHGVDGEGIENIAPPLKGSQYVEGPSERLAMIILNGLEGPVHINNVFYKFNGSMPNFGNNYTDDQIADVIKYLHNAFVSKPVQSIKAEKIEDLRHKNSGTLTESDLLEMAESSKRGK
jgi:mono/diheme cytochrome c family protein